MTHNSKLTTHDFPDTDNDYKSLVWDPISS